MSEKISLTSRPRLKKKEPCRPRYASTDGVEGAGLSTFCFHFASLDFRLSPSCHLTAVTNNGRLSVGIPTAVALKVAVTISQPAMCIWG